MLFVIFSGLLFIYLSPSYRPFSLPPSLPLALAENRCVAGGSPEESAKRNFSRRVSRIATGQQAAYAAYTKRGNKETDKRSPCFLRPSLPPPSSRPLDKKKRRAKLCRFVPPANESLNFQIEFCRGNFLPPFLRLGATRLIDPHGRISVDVHVGSRSCLREGYKGVSFHRFISCRRGQRRSSIAPFD